MKPQETKFTFVYNEIKQSILEGQILPGNALLSPHCATFTEDSRRRMSLRLAEEIEKIFSSHGTIVQ